jgi:hypothetical protein
MTCLSSLSEFIERVCSSKIESTAVLALHYMAVSLHYMEHLAAALDEQVGQKVAVTNTAVAHTS